MVPVDSTGMVSTSFLLTAFECLAWPSSCEWCVTLSGWTEVYVGFKSFACSPKYMAVSHGSPNMFTEVYDGIASCLCHMVHPICLVWFQLVSPREHVFHFYLPDGVFLVRLIQVDDLVDVPCCTRLSKWTLLLWSVLSGYFNLRCQPNIWVQCCHKMFNAACSSVFDTRFPLFISRKLSCAVRTQRTFGVLSFFFSCPTDLLHISEDSFTVLKSTMMYLECFSESP